MPPTPPTPRQRLEDLFHLALDLPSDQRVAMLDRECGADAPLRAEIDALLAEDASGTRGLLAQPATALIDDAPAPIPDRLGEFRILGLLGEGGMGRVYEAEQDSPRRTVALKVIQPGSLSRSALRRFELEAQVLAGLKHPGIAQVHQVGKFATPGDLSAPPQPYFAMELVRGPSLIEFARTRALGERERLALLAKVADAVQHAHQRGVIHRDLKPANILVEDAPDGPADDTATRGGISAQPKVLDFGIARLTDQEASSISLRTEAGAMVGTLAYMSPEQVEADPANIDTRCDVYALGVIGYELLAGRPPIDVAGKPVFEAARLVLQSEPPPLGRIDPALRGDVETIIAKAMDKAPARRYATAAELAADIRRHLHDQPIAARPATTLYHFGKFARRNRALVGAAAIALVALLGGAAALAVGLVRATRAEAEARATAHAEAAQRAIAERRSSDVRALATTLVYDVEVAIEDLPGSTAARRLVVNTGMKYLDGLAAESEGNTRLLWDLADGYRRLAEILGKTSGANLGDTPGAIAAINKAIAILEPIQRGAPERGNFADALHQSLDVLADLQRTSGHIPEAIATYTRSLGLARIAAAAKPGDLDIQDELVLADASLGRMKDMTGDPAGALDHYARARDHFRARALPDLADDRLASNSGVMGLKFGEALAEVGRTDEAEQALRASLDWQRRVVAKHPNYMPGRTTELSLSTAVGRVVLNAGCAGEGVPLLEHVCAAYHRLCDADPSDARARRNLGVSYFWLIKAYETTHRDDLALLAGARFRDITAESLRTNPAYTVTLHDAALGEAFYGYALQRLGQVDAAADHLGAAVTLLQGLLFSEPENTPPINSLLEHITDLGEMHAALAASLPAWSDQRPGHADQARGCFTYAHCLAAYLESTGRMSPACLPHAKRADAALARLDRPAENPLAPASTLPPDGR